MAEPTYACPTTLAETFALLAKAEGNVQFMAGGTDLMIDLGKVNASKIPVIDLTRVAELQGITEENGYVYIGGAVTHSDVAASPLIRKHAKALAEACSKVGSIQIRNIGTLGGNVVTALPAADGAVALFALEAECEVYTAAGKSQWFAVDALYEGVGKSTVKSQGHVLSRIRFKVDEHRTTAYQRMEIRKALSLPMLCTAVALRMENGKIAAASVVIAPAGPAPMRASVAEEWLVGKTPSLDVFNVAGALSLKSATIRGSAVRGSKAYREKVLPVFVQRALSDAVNL